MAPRVQQSRAVLPDIRLMTCSHWSCREVPVGGSPGACGSQIESAMSVDPVPPSHPVLVCASSVHAALDRVAALPATYLGATEKRTALLELTRAVARDRKSVV